MNVLQILINIMNAGIDYDLTRGDKEGANKKRKARNRILDQLLARKK